MPRAAGASPGSCSRSPGREGSRSPSGQDEGRCVRADAIVPQKLFRLAKSRLAVALPPEARGALSLALLRTVCAALRAAPAIEDIVVVTPDPIVRAWADAWGVRTLVDHGVGLNAALRGALGSLGSPSQAV